MVCDFHYWHQQVSYVLGSGGVALLGHTVESKMKDFAAVISDSAYMHGCMDARDKSKR